MRVLIVYGTVEGQTGKIAEFIETKARAMGHEVTRFDTAQKLAPVSFEGVDRIILAASVHERRHPVTFEVFLTAHRAELGRCKTLMLSVSLSAAFENGMEDAQDYLTEMEMRTGFTPDCEALVAGAVRTGSYDYFATQVVRHVVLKDRDYDPSAGAHEFTDWNALEARVQTFLAAR